MKQFYPLGETKEETVEKHNKYEYVNKKINKYH